MIRRLRNLLTLLSLLLCVAVVGLWVRSCFVADGLQWVWTDVDSTVATSNWVYLHSDKGNLHCGRNRSRTQAKPHDVDLFSSFRWHTTDPTGVEVVGDSLVQRMGFRFGRLERQETAVANGARIDDEIVEFSTPYWAMATAGALLPAAWWARRRRLLRRSNGGRCARCNYDLRATPDRCPECGSPAATTPA